jgi:hypothetical protein
MADPVGGGGADRPAADDEEVARWTSELAGRGRVTAAVPVEVVDAAGTVVVSATVEWFIARGNPEAEPGATPDPAQT